MHRVVLGGRLSIAAAVLVALVVGLRAQAPAERQAHDVPGAKAGHAPAKYTVTLHQDGAETEKVYDPANPKDHEELILHFKAGHLEKMEKVKEINILALSWELSVYSIIVFLLLLFVLSKVAWKPMLEGLRRREMTIRDALDEAKKARDDARLLHEKYDSEMRKAGENARDIMDEARRDATRLIEEERAKAKSEIAAERDRLYRELNLAKDQALHEMWQQSAQLATLISSKAIRRQINADDHRALLEEALTEMRGAETDRETFTSGKA